MRKKILFVHHTIKMSGAPKSLGLLLKNIDLEKFDPYVLLIGKGQVSEYYETLPVKIIYQPGIFPFHGSTVTGMNTKIALVNLIGAIPTYMLAKRVIKKVRPDIIHLNSTCLFNVAKAAKAVNKDIPVVTHIREPILNNFWGSILRSFNNKYANGYISIDQHDLKLMDCKTKKSVIVFNYADFLSENVVDSPVKENDQCLKFLFLGRIRKSNGLYELVQMINQVFENDKRCKFLIAGFSKEKTQFEKKVLYEIGSAKNIEAIEFTNDILGLIDSADVIISPFTEPHFSRAVVEGASLSKPALITDVYGQNELIIDGQTGLKYQKNNVDDFYKKVSIMIDNKQRVREMGTNAREFALENFNEKVNANKTYEFIESFL